MNESILRSLMRLFALVADVDQNGNFGNKRDIVMDYLDRHYSKELALLYIHYFDEQLKILHPDKIASGLSDDDFEIRHHGKVEEICRQINEELEMSQKVVVIISLLDFINRGEALTFREQKLVFKVAVNLKLNLEEFKDLRAFTFDMNDKIVDKSKLLFIDSELNPPHPDIKHMPNPRMEGRISVIHLESTNTYVFRYNGNLNFLLNGHQIKPKRSYIWSVGSVIKNTKVGSLYYTRMAGKFIQANIESHFVYTAQEIEFRYGNSTNGIRKFTFTEESGRLVGIIGGSGSGKSTLLNVFNGNLRPRSGKISINGYDIHKYKEELRGVIGYVPQDDMLIKELSVYQNLYYNARLSFSESTEAEINTIVENALADFDLVEASDLVVGDKLTTVLSGGQRKRLNMALELIREPSILFVDEPTSGLSSADSEKVINLLKRLTFKGNLVIANIHQPSSDIFKMFDKLLVMDQGGRIIYYGNPMDGITYFKRISHYADAEESECPSCGNINSDQILRTVEARVVDANGRLTRKRKTAPQEWYEQYIKNIDPEIRKINREHDGSIPKSNFRTPGRFKQFIIYLKRDLLAKYYNKQYLIINVLEAPLLAAILAFFTKRFIFVDGIPKYIFSENPNIPSFIFMAVIVSLFMGLVISAEEIFKDRILLKREKFLSLSRSSYLFSKVAILFLFSALQTLIFVLISTKMLGIDGMMWRYWLVLFSASCWANLMGLNISAGLNSVVTIYILIPLILVPQLLFSGVVVDFDKMHNKIASDRTVPTIGDMMTSRWAYEALMVTQFKDNKFEKHFFTSEMNLNNSNYYRSFAIPKLRELLDEASRISKNLNDSVKFNHNIKVVHNELENMAAYMNTGTIPRIDHLKSETYNDTSFKQVQAYLDKAERSFVAFYNKSVQERDAKYDELVNKYGGIEKFRQFKQKYHNKQIASVVTNENEIAEYYIQNDELIPLKNSVYKLPASDYGRAHYYAPFKKVANFLIDSFWFNIVIIWIFGGLLFALLYFDILRKIITYFETLRLNRINRRRFLRLIKITDQHTNKKTN